MKRTHAIELDKTFEVEVEVTKTWQNANGDRFIRGVASGLDEDRDGERVSARAIAKMAKDVEAGGVKLTSAHTQDWMTEIGDVVKASVDPETGELLIDTKLPPEGEDPIADKAWRVANREPIGFSIGGKLRKAYFELTDVGKRRKVLDLIDLRHVMLTKKPSYSASFAEAVAKSFDGAEPEESAFVDEESFLEEPVEKATPSAGDERPARSDRKKKAPVMDAEDQDREEGEEPAPEAEPPAEEEEIPEADPTDDLPEPEEEPEEDPTAGLDRPPSRHLACPNCGHEFAADMPGDQDFDAPQEDLGDEENDNDRTTKKTVREETPTMPLNDTLKKLQGLVDADEVEKTEPEATEEPVEKTVESVELPDVLKMLAASHEAQEQSRAELEDQLGEAFGTVAKAIQGLAERIDALPRGRRSVARIVPPPTEERAGGEAVEKSVEEQVAETENPIEALKALNRATYGIE